MDATLVNGWWMTTNNYIGTTNTSNVSSMMTNNATLVYNWFTALGWSLSAIAGILGNMHSECTINPAYIQLGHRSTLPNSAANLTDVPNSIMIDFFSSNSRGYGIGLVQWDGPNTNNPPQQKLVGFAERYSLTWYEGNTQLYRIQREYETDIQFVPHTINGVRWSWSNYVYNQVTPEESAHIWRLCYERGGDASDSTRQANARYWYEYFSGGSPTPTPTPTGWITGSEFATLALAYNGRYIPYTQMDCITFVQAVWRDIPSVQSSWVVCSPLGTNTWWRTNTSEYPNLVKTFNTTSPFNQNPTPTLWYKDTLDNCESSYGEIPTGALLFHKIGDNDNPPNTRYPGDGVGNFAHVGIYCGNNQVMQSGGRDSSSIPGGGVHLSTFDSSAWNYVAFVAYVDPTGGESPEPEEPEEPEFPLYLDLILFKRKKEYHGKRYF